MRPAALALAASAALAAACTAPETVTCPGTRVADFRFEGTLVLQGDRRVDALDPSDYPDCTPDAAAPIQFPPSLPAFDARLSADPESDGAALCRSNGSVLSGTRSGASYTVEADASSAILCNSACAASLRVVVKGDVAVDGGGAPTSFAGILVEELTHEALVCDGCLPAVPGSDPAQLACAARYALTGTLY